MSSEADSARGRYSTNAGGSRLAAGGLLATRVRRAEGQEPHVVADCRRIRNRRKEPHGILGVSGLSLVCLSLVAERAPSCRRDRYVGVCMRDKCSV